MKIDVYNRLDMWQKESSSNKKKKADFEYIFEKQEQAEITGIREKQTHVNPVTEMADAKKCNTFCYKKGTLHCTKREERKKYEW